MTRSFNQFINCRYCGAQFDAQTDFCRWMRGCRDLDSADGVVRSDFDHIIHRYTYPGTGRDVQACMIVEVKTNCARPSDSQVDTLHIINQVIRNRRSNVHSDPKSQVKGGILRVRSWRSNKDVLCRVLGVHLLQFSGTSPSNGRIWWDRKEIDAKTLIAILRLDFDPDLLRPIDLRIHQSVDQHPTFHF